MPFAAMRMSAFDAVDGSSTGTEVPCMWVLLRAKGERYKEPVARRPSPDA
jgi:hypothetical protein